MQVSMWIRKRVASYLERNPARLTLLCAQAVDALLHMRGMMLDENERDIARCSSNPDFKEMLSSCLAAKQSLDEDVAFLEALEALLSRDRECEIPDLLRHVLKELGCPKRLEERLPVSLN